MKKKRVINKSKELYLFSGLGADERVFQNLEFAEYTCNYIKWVEPQIDEKIEQYASRLLKQISTPNPILIGLSFGGIMAIEVAKQIQIEQLILIASVKTNNEIPFYYRLIGMIGIHKIIPTSLLKKSNFISNWFFGAHSSHDKLLLKNILADTNPTFLKWAIDSILKWNNQTEIHDTIHIHGTNDNILPIKYTHCNFQIANGGHLMTLNQSDEINKVLKNIL